MEKSMGEDNKQTEKSGSQSEALKPRGTSPSKKPETKKIDRKKADKKSAKTKKPLWVLALPLGLLAALGAGFAGGMAADKLFNRSAYSDELADNFSEINTQMERLQSRVSQAEAQNKKLSQQFSEQVSAQSKAFQSELAALEAEWADKLTALEAALEEPSINRAPENPDEASAAAVDNNALRKLRQKLTQDTVSYTHLTLPTIYSV